MPKNISRSLTVTTRPEAWALFDELCERTRRRPGGMFSRILDLMANVYEPWGSGRPEIIELEQELHGLLTEALRPGTGRVPAATAGGAPLLTGHTIDFGAAAAKLRLLHGREL